MRAMKQVLILTITCFIWVGCAKVPNKEFTFAEDPNAAIAIFSVTHDRKPGSAAACAVFYVFSDGHENYQVLKSQNSNVGILGNEFDENDDYGQFLPIVLSAGTHHIDKWDIRKCTGMGSSPSEGPMPLIFSLKAGEVKYLGNLHGKLTKIEKFLGVPVFYFGYPEIRDRQERDIPMFEQRYPQFKGKVVIDLLPLGPWVSNREEANASQPD